MSEVWVEVQCAAEAAAAMLEGGAGILQLRIKGHWSRQTFEEAQSIAALCREAGAMFIIDDRAEFAALLGAGLHVGQDDLPAGVARKLIGPDAVLGFSTHNARQLCSGSAEPADYLALGPIYPTASKRNPDPVLGLEQLRECRLLAERPLVAIGGISRDNALNVLRAGADSVAVIRDLLPEPCTRRAVRERMEEWQQLVKQP